MTLSFARVSISTRRKLTSILLAVTIFALLAGLTSFATRGSVVYAIIDSMFVVAVPPSHLLTGQLDTLSRAYRRMPFALPLMIAFSVIGIVVMRTVHFI